MPEYQAPAFVNKSDPAFDINNAPKVDAAQWNSIAGAVQNHGGRILAAEADITALVGSVGDLEAQPSPGEAVAAHAAAGNPHPVYLTQDEGDDRYLLESASSGFAVADATTTALAAKQPLDADLTAVAALTPTNDDLLQRKGGVWTNRTPAQVKADLGISTGGSLTVRNTTANTTAVVGELLTVDASGGARTITPPASPTAGDRVTVLKTDSTANTVTWSGTTNGDANAEIITQWAGATFAWDGAGWLVLSTTA